MSVAFTKEQKDKLILARSVTATKYHVLIKKYHTASEAIKHIDYKAYVDDEIKAIEKADAELVFYGDTDYPAQLLYLVDAPPVLTIKGKKELLYKSLISIVGSRQATLPSRVFAKSIAHELGLSGQVIVSGVAAGIDAQAHLGSLHTGTIGVLGAGLNIIYPMENAKLYEDIAKYGLLVSEYGMNHPVKRESFPQRNRIISGLCWGCIIIEASAKSGSLITAQYAIDQGKELFAIPGHPMDPASRGCNRLIKEGAILIETSDDVLTYYNTLANQAFNAAAQQIHDSKTIVRADKKIKQKKLVEQTYSIDEIEDRYVQKDKISRESKQSRDAQSEQKILDADIKNHKKNVLELDFELEDDVNISFHDKILTLLSTTGIYIGDLQKALQCDIRSLRIALTELEISNKIHVDYRDFVIILDKLQK